MIIREEIEIHAPLPVVWQVFSCLEEWENWNSVCQSCEFVEGSDMSEGACVTFVLRPFSLPITVSPKITKCVPGREVLWEGERLGIQAVHKFAFSEEKDKVILLSIEKFRGPLIWLGRLIFLPSKLHRLTKQLLLAIKKEAEHQHAAAGGN